MVLAQVSDRKMTIEASLGKLALNLNEYEILQRLSHDKQFDLLRLKFENVG